MYHNLQQAQQLLHTIDQMVAQMRQQEATNQQMLSQIEQREGQATQKLNQIQQMCQEVSRVLQNAVAVNQSLRATMPMQGSFQHEISSPMGYIGMGYQASGVNLGQQQNVGAFLPTQSPLIDPATMEASTYYDSLKQFGAQGNQSLFTPGTTQAAFSGISSFGAQSTFGMGAQSTSPAYSGSSISTAGVNLGQSQSAGATLPTQSPLVDPTTMSASTYYDSLKQFGAQGNQSLFTPGAAAGIASGSSISSSGQGGIFSTQPSQTGFASSTAMGSDKFQSAAQKIGGTGISAMGQQSGISTRQ